MLRLELFDISDVIGYQQHVVSAIPELQEALGPGQFRDWFRRLLRDLASRIASTPFTSLRSSDAEMRGTLRELFAPELDADVGALAPGRVRSKREQALLKAIRTTCSQLTTSPVDVYGDSTITRLVIERPGRSRGRAFEGEYAVHVAYWGTRDEGGYFRWRFRSRLGYVYDRHGLFNLLSPKRFGILAERSVTWARRWEKHAPGWELIGCEGIVGLQLLHIRATLQAVLQAGSHHAALPLLLTLFEFRLRDAPTGMLLYDDFINRLAPPDGVEPAPFLDFCQIVRRACHITLVDKLLAINCYRHLSADERAELISFAQANERKDEPYRAWLEGSVTALLATSVIDIEAFIDDVEARLTPITPLVFNE